MKSLEKRGKKKQDKCPQKRKKPNSFTKKY